MNEHSFVKAVRNGSIKQPNQRGFSIEKWDDAFKKIEHLTDNDVNLYNSGIWFYNRLNTVRAMLESQPKINLPKYQIIRMYVSKINMIARQLYYHPTRNINIVNNQKLTSSSEAFSAQAINSIVTLVDGARYPLSTELQKPQSKPPYTTSQKDIDKYISTGLDMGIVYDQLESLWASCLWQDWHVSELEEFDLVIPSYTSREEEVVIGDFRDESFLGQDAAHAYYFWKDLSLEAKSIILSGERIVDIIEEKNISRIITGTISSIPSIPPVGFLARMEVAEEYFDDFIDLKLKNLHNISIRQLLDSWMVLSEIAIRMMNDKNSPKNNEYSMMLLKKNIEDVLVKTIKISYIEANYIIDIFTFSGDHRNELWFYPFVPVDDKRITFVLPALLAPNLIRSVDHWIKKDKLDVGAKGSRFETFIRDSLIHENILDFVFINTKAMNFKVDNGNEEEIDLLILIGNNLLVGEIKCSTFPASPLDYHNYFMVLQDGADRARRKADFVKRNIKEFLHQREWQIEDLNSINIYPIVVTNIRSGSGLTFSEVPVLDIHMLKIYFAKGKVILFATSDQDDFHIEQEEILYYTKEEAQNNILQYINSPPQLKQLRSFVKKTVVPMYSFQSDAKLAFIIQSTVQTPEIIEL